MATVNGADLVAGWPEESQEAARLVMETYGQPHEATESLLMWHGVGPWKLILASRVFHEHHFPVPHIDSVESVIDYHVPEDKVGAVVKFDGSVIVERTAGEVSARCHDEQANMLALNLVHDIVTGERTVEQAREYYAKEFLDFRCGEPTPYMDELRVPPPDDSTGDPDERVLSDEELRQAAARGEQ